MTAFSTERAPFPCVVPGNWGRFGPRCPGMDRQLRCIEKEKHRWGTSFIGADGKIFDGAPPAYEGGQWTLRRFEIVTAGDVAPDLGAFLLSFGDDARDELYVLTSERPGPMGSTGKVYKLVPNR